MEEMILSSGRSKRIDSTSCVRLLYSYSKLCKLRKHPNREYLRYFDSMFCMIPRPGMANIIEMQVTFIAVFIIRSYSPIHAALAR